MNKSTLMFTSTFLLLGALLPGNLEANPTTASREKGGPEISPGDVLSHRNDNSGADPMVSATLHKKVANPIQQINPAFPANDQATASATASFPMLDESSRQKIELAVRDYTAIAAHGGWEKIPLGVKFAYGSAGEHVESLRRRLLISQDLTSLDANGRVFDAAMVAGVKRFQSRHGIPETGALTLQTIMALNVPVDQRIQQLQASAKRIAEVGFGFGRRYVVVNIPAAQAEAVEEGRVARRYRVIVGKKGNPSPTVTTEISEINLNPVWTVPVSIIKNDIAVRAREDVNYLDRAHMQVFDVRNTAINSRSIDWSSGSTSNLVVRQQPGPWNALGQVRINMPNAYSVFMHDTNQKKRFADDYRFGSHGCVRVDNIRDLATWLLQKDASWNSEKIQAAIDSRQRRDIQLKTRVLVVWIYLTAWISSDQTVQFRDDVYGLDEQMVRASAEVGAFFDQAERTTP